VASVDVASVATDAGEKTDAAENAAGLASSALAVSTATFLAAAAGRSNDSSDSEDSDMIGGGADIPPGSPSGDNYEFSEYPADDDDDADDDDMPTDAEASISRFWNVSSITWSGCKLVKIIAKLWSLRLWLRRVQP
jgi:hypothetical protein